MHEVGARRSFSSPDLSKMLFNQISACNVVLVVPDGPHVVGLLIIMGFLKFLLEPKLFKDLKVDKTGVKAFAAEPLVLEGKACAHDDLL